MCTGLVTVAPFFGSMKNTRGFFAAAFAAGFFACALDDDAEPGDQHEDRQHELLPDFHKRSPFAVTF